MINYLPGSISSSEFQIESFEDIDSNSAFPCTN